MPPCHLSLTHAKHSGFGWKLPSASGPLNVKHTLASAGSYTSKAAQAPGAVWLLQRAAHSATLTWKRHFPPSEQEWLCMSQVPPWSEGHGKPRGQNPGLCGV